MDRGGGASQIVDLVGLEIERKRHIVPDHFKTMMIEHALDVTTCSGEIIIDANDAGALLEQTLAEVGAEKSGASSDQHTRFEVQPQSPRGIGLIQLSPGHLNKSADLST